MDGHQSEIGEKHFRAACFPAKQSSVDLNNWIADIIVSDKTLERCSSCRRKGLFESLSDLLSQFGCQFISVPVFAKFEHFLFKLAYCHFDESGYNHFWTLFCLVCKAFFDNTLHSNKKFLDTTQPNLVKAFRAILIEETASGVCARSHLGSVVCLILWYLVQEA